MKIKYIITEERKVEKGKAVSLFQLDTQIEDIKPYEMPSMLLAERMETIQMGFIQQFMEQDKKYLNAPEKVIELFQQGISLHFQSPCPTNDTEESPSRETP